MFSKVCTKLEFPFIFVRSFFSEILLTFFESLNNLRATSMSGKLFPPKWNLNLSGRIYDDRNMYSFLDERQPRALICWITLAEGCAPIIEGRMSSLYLIFQCKSDNWNNLNSNLNYSLSFSFSDSILISWSFQWTKLSYFRSFVISPINRVFG